MTNEFKSKQPSPKQLEWIQQQERFSVSNIIECLITLNEFHNPHPSKITHHKGTDDWGDYEYWQYAERGRVRFSSPDLHDFIESVMYKIIN